jgi:hypothetical protein
MSEADAARMYLYTVDETRELRVGDVLVTPDGIEVCTSIAGPPTWASVEPPAELCSSCGEQQARHTVYSGEGRRRLCCSCSYTETGVAADWHPGCIAAEARSSVQ